MSASFENSSAPETRSLIASRLSQKIVFRLHITPVVKPKNIFVVDFLPGDLTYIWREVV